MLMKQTKVPVNSLKYAPHNPPTRSILANIQPLMNSMELRGLIYPIIIDLNDTIIEGHRRTAAAIILGWETIPAYIVKDVDAASLFGELNTTSRKLNGAEALYVWFHNPLAVVPSQRIRFKEMQTTIGRKVVARIVDKGLSFNVFSLARRLSIYCGHKDYTMIKATTEWLLDCPCTIDVRKAMQGHISPIKIMKAITEGKVLKVTQVDS